jgi:hypothetical protein
MPATEQKMEGRWDDLEEKYNDSKRSKAIAQEAKRLLRWMRAEGTLKIGRCFAGMGLGACVFRLSCCCGHRPREGGELPMM